MLPAAVAAALALQFAGLYLPFLQELLHTQPLTGLDLAVVFLASTLGYAAVRLDRVLFRRIRRRSGAGPGDPELRGRPKSRLAGPVRHVRPGR
jgi:Ca2+-transporting ATPase